MKQFTNRQSGPGGYLTIYLSLTLAVLLTLYFVLMQGARENAVRMQTEVAVDIAGNSVLAEYHRELQRQYDLFFVDTSYGGAPSLANTEQHFREYLEKNFQPTGVVGSWNRREFTGTRTENVAIDGARYAAQDNAAPLREQVYAYMAAEPVEEAIAGILARIDTFNGLSLESGEWQQRRSDSEQALAEAEAPKRIDENGEEVEEPIENPGEAVIGFRATPVLDQVITNLDMVSMESTDVSKLISHRGGGSPSRYDPENTHGYPSADAIVFDEYILEKCGTYRTPLEKSLLKYQAEYILFGEGSDEQNLERMARRLMVIREAANCIYLFSDEGKRNEARTLATVLACCVLNPELEELITPVILFAWAYLEAVQDVKSLMAGGRVPLLKDSSSWKVPLMGIFAPAFATRADTGGSGLSYEDYLRIFLYLQDGTLKNYRLMDVMEMDIRKTSGNAGFRMDACIDAFHVQTAVTGAQGYAYETQQEFGYN